MFIAGHDEIGQRVFHALLTRFQMQTIWGDWHLLRGMDGEVGGIILADVHSRDQPLKAMKESGRNIPETQT